MLLFIEEEEGGIVFIILIFENLFIEFIFIKLVEVVCFIVMVFFDVKFITRFEEFIM